MTGGLRLMVLCGIWILCFLRAFDLVSYKKDLDQTDKQRTRKSGGEGETGNWWEWAWLVLGVGPDVIGIDVTFAVGPLDSGCNRKRMSKTASEGVRQSITRDHQSAEIIRQTGRGSSQASRQQDRRADTENTRTPNNATGNGKLAIVPSDSKFSLSINLHLTGFSFSH